MPEQSRTTLTMAATLVAESDDCRVSRIDDQIYVVQFFAHASRELLSWALDQVWAQPTWQQPWALAVVMEEGATYDVGIRTYDMPPRERRAVATAVITKKSLQRMVVTSIGLGMKLAQHFELSAWATLDEAVPELRVRLEKATSQGRQF